MTVSSTINKSGPYSGNGVTVDFEYEFRILDEAHITVVKAVGGVETVLTLAADYTVSGVGALVGGSITLDTPPATGETITLVRNASFDQQVDLENQGAYYAETVERALDLGAMRDQQLAEGLARAVQIPISASPADLDHLVGDIIRLGVSADQIDTVANISGAVSTVAGISADVSEVSAVTAAVSTVAGISADVTAVAGIAANINAVAGIEAEIIAVPAQVQAAEAAKGAAEDARDAAAAVAVSIGDVVEPFLHDRQINVRLMMGDVIGGVAGKKIAFLGDSTTMGVGSGVGGANTNGARRNTPVAVACRLIQARGVAARDDAFFGHNGISSLADYQTYNADVQLAASGWVFTEGQYVGGAFFSNSSTWTSTYPLTFTPRRVCDRFDLYYATVPSGGKIVVSDSSGVLQTIDTAAGSNGIGKTTVSRAVASMTPILIYREANVGVIHVAGVDPWNSILPELRMLNLGVSGWRAGDYYSTTLGFSARHGLTRIAADYTYIEFGLNEKALGGTIPASMSNLQTLAQSLLSYSDIAIGVSAPADASVGHNLTPDWQLAIRTVADDNGWPCVDHYSRFVSYVAAETAYFDTVHLNPKGSAIKGRILADWLLA